MGIIKIIKSTIADHIGKEEGIFFNDGRTYYHGTNSEKIKITDLNPSGLGGDYGSGIYFTTEKDYAERQGKFVLSTKIKSTKYLIIGSDEYFKKIYPEIGTNVRFAADVTKKMGYTTLEVPRSGDDKWIIVLDKRKVKYK